MLAVYYVPPIQLVPLMARTKRKTTIAFDPDNFVKLQNIAALQNRTVTDILNELIEGYVKGKLPDGYEERIKDKVFALVDQRVESDYLDAIAEKVASLLSSQKSTTDTARTIETEASTLNPIAANDDPKYQNFILRTSTSEEKSTTDTARTAKKKTEDKTTKEDRQAENIAKFKRYKASDNKKSHDDQYVASQLGVGKETVRRYRKGLRSPKQEFIDAWGLNWSGEQWIRNI